MSAPADTPLQQIGRLIEDVERRHESHDFDGSVRGLLTKEHDDRLMVAFHEARMALYEAACDQRAETAADVVVQLFSAFVTIDCNIDWPTEAQAENANIQRVRTAIVSALSVALRSVNDTDAIPCKDAAEDAVRLVFEPKSPMAGAAT